MLMAKPTTRKRPDKPRGDIATRFKKGNKISRLGGLASVAAKAKGRRLTAVLRDVLENCTDPKSGLTYNVAVNVAMAQEAALGNVKAFNSIMNRIEGKPIQAVELSGPAKAPIKTIRGGMTLEEKAQAYADMAAGKVPETPTPDGEESN
jgi:hypothetical protein